MTIHVANTVAAFISELKQKITFNGVRFAELYDETPTAPEPDEQTQEQFDKLIEGYAIFVAYPDLYIDGFDCDDNEYISKPVISWKKFESDFANELQKRLGDDVKIEYKDHPHEYECVRTLGYSYAKEQNKERLTLKVREH
jgi:hypothetical protein